MAQYSTNREHKDRLFRFIFGKEEHKEYLLSLYNALNNTTYDKTDDLTITTIDDVIYMQMKNDVSCIISNQMNLYEHQSTVNPNMPFREFEYSAKLYDKYIIEQKLDLYGKKQIKIPAPKCYVLYNGTEDYPEYMELKLSDAFMEPSSGYEWTSYVYNINAGYNKDLMKKCDMLGSYSDFIEAIRQVVKTMNITVEEAVDESVKEFIKRGGEFGKMLLSHRAEVIDMCITEYDAELHEQTLREEGREEGIAEGIIKGEKNAKIKMAIKMNEQGSSVQIIADLLEVPEEQVKEWLNNRIK